MIKRKRKLNTWGKFLVFLLIVFILYKVFNFNDIDDINYFAIVESDYSDYVVDTSEEDNSFIKENFASGMNVDDYISILKKKTNYIFDNGEYNKINYDFDRKLHYSEIEDMIINMNNSDIVDVEIIGKSVDNRNIYGIEVGNGDSVLYLDANIHAAEVGNTPILMRFLSDILNKYEDNDKDIIELLNTKKIVVIPCINPDGYEVYNFGIDSLNNKDLWIYQNKDKIDFNNIKSNANGVDINRNFPSQNMGFVHINKKLISSVSFDKTTNRSIYFGGVSAGSEPETRASMYFMLKHHKNVYAYINFHSQGRVIYTGKPNLSKEYNILTNKIVNIMKKKTSYFMFGLADEEVGEGNDGTASDFMAELANGFKFSSVTGRLSLDRYENNSSKLVYKYPAIVIETLNRYTSDPKYFKEEYYDHNISDMLYALLEYNS